MVSLNIYMYMETSQSGAIRRKRVIKVRLQVLHTSICITLLVLNLHLP